MQLEFMDIKRLRCKKKYNLSGKQKYIKLGNVSCVLKGITC